MRTLLIIPAFNESDSLPSLINFIKQELLNTDYIIINDGSVDDTKQVCENNNYNFINLPINSGIGVAVQTGYRYALENNYDIAVQIDGDGQHDVSYLKDVITPIMNNETDIVIGSRFINKEGFQSTGSRRFGIRILSYWIFMLSGVRIKDVTSGYRAVNKKFIKIFAEDYSQDYPEPEAIITAKMYGGRIMEIPVKMKERIMGKSSITFGKSVYYMIKVTLAIFVKRISYGIRREKNR